MILDTMYCTRNNSMLTREFFKTIMGIIDLLGSASSSLASVILKYYDYSFK